jgi:hypothetical protein
MFERILIAKVNWGDFYQGEQLQPTFPDLQGVGEDYERFNFRRTADGRFYGSIPRKVPKVNDKWRVVFVSRDQDGSYRPIGWYEDATFEPQGRERPEYAYDSSMPSSPKYGKFTYDVSTDKAYVISPALRNHFVVPAVANEKIQSATYVFARGQSPRNDEPWRQELARFAERVASGQLSI